MRLTLRNLLRFLDQSELRSLERARLEQLVDESDSADAWIKRIDSLRHNGSTPVPSLDDADCSMEQVVSYLDGSMTEEATSEFEKSLLGSDQRLAEVASCHEIRESILSEGYAPVPLLLRQSMYDLGREVNYDQAVRAREARQAEVESKEDDEAIDTEHENEVAQMAASMHDLPYVDASPDEPEPLLGFSKEPDEVDDDDEFVSLDQLQNKAARNSSIRVLALLAGALALIGATFGLGWYAGSLPKSLDGNSEVAKISGDGQEGDPKAGQIIMADSDTDNTEIGDNGDGDKQTASTDDGSAKVVDADTNDNTTNVAQGSLHPVLPPPKLEVPPDPNALPQKPDLLVLNLDGSAATAVEPPKKEVVLLQVANVASSGKRALMLGKEPGSWQFSAAGAGLKEQSRMFVLAGDQLELDFGGNVKVTIVGPADFQLNSRDIASQADGITINFGEFLVNSSKSDVDFWLQRDNRQYRITFPEQGSSLVAHFYRYHQPGSDPRSEAVANIDRLQVSSGRANVDDRQKVHSLTAGQGMAQSVSINEPLSRALVKGNLSAVPPQPRSIERLSEVIEDNERILEIEDQALLIDHLIDMKSDRRQEFRYAAVAWMATLGNYDHLVDFLNETSNRGNWSKITDVVRRSIQDEPKNAQQLYDAFQAAGSTADGDIMYKSVLGMSPKELENDGDSKLVEWLTNDELPVRVLAIEAIKIITEGRTYGYVPYAESTNRKRVVQRQWSKVLKKNELRYPNPPTMPFPKLQEPDSPDDGQADPADADNSNVPDESGESDPDSRTP